MKPFNLEEAKTGKPVCTRDGRDVRILCFDRKDKLYNIVALVLVHNDEVEDIISYTKDGLYDLSGSFNPIDLFMKPEKKEGWINIYPNHEVGTLIYNSKENAIIGAGEKLVKTIKIEWEE